jgi:hypothetical protein
VILRVYKDRSVNLLSTSFLYIHRVTIITRSIHRFIPFFNLSGVVFFLYFLFSLYLFCLCEREKQFSRGFKPCLFLSEAEQILNLQGSECKHVYIFLYCTSCNITHMFTIKSLNYSGAISCMV